MNYFETLKRVNGKSTDIKFTFYDGRKENLFKHKIENHSFHSPRNVISHNSYVLPEVGNFSKLNELGLSIQKFEKFDRQTLWSPLSLNGNAEIIAELDELPQVSLVTDKIEDLPLRKACIQFDYLQAYGLDTHKEFYEQMETVSAKAVDHAIFREVIKEILTLDNPIALKYEAETTTNIDYNLLLDIDEDLSDQYENTVFTSVSGNDVKKKLRKTAIGVYDGALSSLAPTVATSLIPERTFIKGDFSRVILRMADSMEVMFNPYAKSDTGRMEVTVIAYFQLYKADENAFRIINNVTV